VNIGNLDVIIDLRGKLPGAEDYTTRQLDAIRYLVVHHTGVPHDTPAAGIARYHAEVLGWPGIGYHFVIHHGGRIEYVGDILQVRYNVSRRNHEVIGVSLTGDFTRHPPGDAQLQAAKDLLANLQLALGSFIPIAGHREIALPAFATSCPGDSFLIGPRWKERVIQT